MHIKTWTKIKKRILQNLNNLICRNKSKLLANRFPGVYQLDCTCNILTKLKRKSSQGPKTPIGQFQQEVGKHGRN